MKKLDLGCGTSKRAGFIGMDRLSLDGVDIVHNLDLMPYPFADNEIDEIWLDQVMEHLFDPLQVMEELHRICKDGATVTIGVPYFRSHYAVIDPTHRHFFSAFWYGYFDPKHVFFHKYNYTNCCFRLERLEFDREFKLAGVSFFHSWIIKIAETWPFFYESKLSHLIPLNSLTYYLRVQK